MNSLQLHRQLTQQFSTIGVKATPHQRANLALLCQALAFSPNCHLATLALGLPLPGRRENLIQHLRRTLKNKQLRSVECYAPLVRHLFHHWPDREVNLVMDRTDLKHDWSILTLGAVHQKRLLPLTWEVLPFGGTGADDQTPLLQRIQPALPPRSQVRINFYGDSEFRAVSVQQCCRDFGWHWQVGLKSDLWFYAPPGEWHPLRDLPLQPGQRCYRSDVFLTREHQFGPLQLLADWSPNQDSPRYWALDLPADSQAWRRGRKRYWIEPGFRDWKSYGFDLEQSHLTDRHRLEGLLLGLAVTTLWMIHVGETLISTGRDDELSARAHTDYSVFRLGRDYLQRCRTLDRAIPVGFTVCR